MYPMEINSIAVIVATILAQAVGFVWYSPMLFFKKWATLSGFSESDLNESKNKGMAKTLTLSVLSTLIMVYVMAYLIDVLVIITVKKAVVLTFLVWLGFIATTNIHEFLWSPKPKPWMLYVLNNGQMFVALLVATLTLCYF